MRSSPFATLLGRDRRRWVACTRQGMSCYTSGSILNIYLYTTCFILPYDVVFVYRCPYLLNAHFKYFIERGYHPQLSRTGGRSQRLVKWPGLWRGCLMSIILTVGEIYGRWSQGTDIQVSQKGPHPITNWYGKEIRWTLILHYLLLGVILRDSHGISQVKIVTGNKILRILKGKG